MTSPSSFGDIDFILSGDFFQFPPVATSAGECLYFPAYPNEHVLSITGSSIYHEFLMVVYLTKQLRVVDPVWHRFLHHLRFGNIEEQDILLLHSLVLTNPDSNRPDFCQQPWKEAVLITPRHGVRCEWNDAAVVKHCVNACHVLFVSPVWDEIDGCSPDAQQREYIATYDAKRRSQGELQDEVKVAIGMHVLITRNINTEQDITNGARGTVVNIILHPEESLDQHLCCHSVVLHHPLSFILVQLDYKRDNGSSRIIPIEPLTRSYRMRLRQDHNWQLKSVRRTQLPITPAYAITDYKAQGQTFPAVIVNIATPPTGGLNLFNLYVSLSRVRSRGGIRILRNFDPKWFQHPHSHHLLEEDNRLRALSESTLSWWNEVKSLM